MPFRLDGLLCRAAAVLRRRVKDTVPAQSIVKDSLTLDIIADQAFINDLDLTLSQKEFAVLLYLIQNEDNILSAKSIYKIVWGSLWREIKTVQVAVSRLRKKIEPAGYDISTIRGQGYLFETNKKAAFAASHTSMLFSKRMPSSA